MNATAEKIGKLLDEVDKLNTFETADQVAEYMRSLGRKGVKGRSDDCVIARHLKNVIGEPGVYLTTSGFDVRYRWGGNAVTRYQGTVYADFKADAGVAGFINAFDRGEYPDLQDTPAPEPVQ